MRDLVARPIHHVVALAAAARPHLETDRRVIVLGHRHAEGGHRGDDHADRVPERLSIDGRAAEGDVEEARNELLEHLRARRHREGGPSEELALIVRILRLRPFDDDLRDKALRPQGLGDGVERGDDPRIEGPLRSSRAHRVEGPRKAVPPGEADPARGRARHGDETRGERPRPRRRPRRLRAEGLPQGRGDEDEDEGEGERHDDRRLLEDRNAPGEEHRDRERTGRGRPEDPQPGGGVAPVGKVPGRQVRHDEGARVRTRHVEEDSDEEGKGDEGAAQRKGVEEGVEAALGGRVGDLLEFRIARADEVERGVAEDRHPHEDVGEGQDEGADDELADRPTARDPGEEHADESSPGDPPGPEEERPAVEPGVGPIVGEGLEGEHREAGEEVADVRDERVEEEGRVPRDEDPQGEAHREEDVDVREDPHTPVDAAHR